MALETGENGAEEKVRMAHKSGKERRGSPEMGGMERGYFDGEQACEANKIKIFGVFLCFVPS